MANTIGKPTYRSPFVDGGGYVTGEWLRWLNQITQAGAAVDAATSALAALQAELAKDETNISALTLRMTAAEAAVTASNAAIKDLQTATIALQNTVQAHTLELGQHQARLDALEAGSGTSDEATLQQQPDAFRDWTADLDELREAFASADLTRDFTADIDELREWIASLDVAGGSGSGAAGPAGSAATVSVGSTTTGAAGSSATVTNTGSSSAAVLAFTIPQGVAGPAGSAASGPANQVLATPNGATGTATLRTLVAADLPSAYALPLTIANGGTGSTTAAAAVTALGAVGLSTTNAFTGVNTFSNSSFQVLGSSSGAFPASGAGVELTYTQGSTTGYVGAYNRTTSVYLPLIVYGSTISLQAASGVSTTGALTVAGTLTASGALTVSGAVTLSTPLPVGSGGTGSTTAAAAVTALGAAGLSTANTFTGANTFSGAMVRVLGSSGGSFPSSGVGLELTYDTGGSIGYVGAYNRTTSTYQSLFLYGSSVTIQGNTGVSITGGPLNVQALTVSGAFTVNTPANIFFGSGWLTWTPTVTASGSMTVSSVTVYYANYIRIGPLVYFIVEVGFTLGGTLSNTVYVTSPLTNAGNTTPVTALLSDAAAGWTPCVGQLGSTTVTVSPAGLGNYPTGGAFIMMSGFYRC